MRLNESESHPQIRAHEPFVDPRRGTRFGIPEEAVIVAGSRAVTSGPGKEWGISVYTPVIVKYRDARTDAKIQLEDLLR